MTNRIRERGEGKIGCVVSLIILALASAAGLKIIPVYYSNNQMTDAATRKAETAGGRKPEDMIKELREEAKNLEIPEAMAPGAINLVKRSGSAEVGSIIVTLRYTRKVDLYGVTQLEIVTDKVIDRPLLENIR